MVKFVRFAFPAFAILVLSFLARPARADSFTVDVTANWMLTPYNLTPINGATTGTITGEYEFDNSSSTGDTVGPWSFDLSSLGIPSVSGSAGHVFDDWPCSDINTCDWVSFSLQVDPVNGYGDLLAFFVVDPSDLTALPLDPSNPARLEWALNTGSDGVYFSSIELTEAMATPEPSSLLLLGCGLFGLLAMVSLGPRIRRFRQSVPPV